MEILDIIINVLFPIDTEYTIALFGIESLIGGIFNATSTNQTNKTNLQIARETNQANRELAEEQNKWNLEQWNRENEYNSPAHQLELLKQAGLNPNLYSGEGATAGSLTSADLANQQIGNPMVAPQMDLQGMAATQMAKTAEKKSGSEIAKNYADAGLSEEQARNLVNQSQLTLQMIKNKQAEEMETTQKTLLAIVQQSLAESQGNYYDEMSKTQESVRQNLDWQNLGIQSQMKVNEKSITLMGSQFSVNKALVNLHNATADKLAVDKSVSYQTIENMKQQLKNLVKEGEVLGKTVEIEGVKLRIMQSEEGLIYLQNENLAAVENAKHDPINLYPAMSAFMSLFGQVFGPAAIVGSKFVK